MLSGFVLSHQLSKLDEQMDLKAYIKYALLRINRIYPAFAFMIIFSFFLRKYFSLSATPQMIPSEWILGINSIQFNLKALVKELLIVVPFASQYRILPQGWSLVLEILVSIIFPFLFVFTRQNKFFLFLFIYFITKFLGLYTIIIVFVCGIYIYQYRKNIMDKIGRFSRSIKLLLFVVGWLLFTLQFFVPEKIISILDKLFIFYSLPGCVLLFCIMISSNTMKKILNHRIFLFLGSISYSIYLVHFTLLLCFSSYIVNIVNNIFTYNELTTRMFYFAIMLFLILAVSTVYYYIIEKPAMNFGKKIIIKIFNLNKTLSKN